MKYNFELLFTKELYKNKIKLNKNPEIENILDLQIDVTLQKSNYSDLTKHVVLISGRTGVKSSTVLQDLTKGCMINLRTHTGRFRKVDPKVKNLEEDQAIYHYKS